MLIGTDCAERLNARISCNRCGNTDYLHSFISGGSSRRQNNSTGIPLDTAFFKIVTDLATDPSTNIDAAIREIAGKYHLSPITIVGIINAFNDLDTTAQHYNPDRFVTIEHRSVSIDDIINEIRTASARASRNVASNIPTSQAAPTGEWKKLYDEACNELAELRRNYDSLLESARMLKEQNQQLENILDNR